MRNALRALAILLAAGWVYFPCLNGTWLWDDGLEVTQNSVLRSPAGWWEPWVRPQGMDYFPLKSSLQWMEWQLWGAHPLGYHLVNVGLHVVSALLVWRLLSVLGVRAAFLGGMLFAVHPLAVESVAWISEFKNTASLPPLLLASIAYVEYDRGARRADWIRALLWFLAALACKTSTVMFPFVILVFAWWRRGRVGRRDLVAAAPFFAAALAMGAATVWFQSARAIGIAGTAGSLSERLAQAGWSIVAYARMSVWPAGLAPIYPPAGGACPGWVPWLGIAAVLSLFWIRRAGWGRHALLAAGWFLLNLAPVAGVIPMSYLRISPRADHFAYVSLVGCVGLAAAALGAALGAWEGRKGRGAAGWVPFTLGAAAVAALGAQSRAYAAAFRSEEALWTVAVERNPDAWLARNNLGRELLQEGRPGDAEGQFREAVRIQPDSPEAHANLGNALDALGLSLLRSRSFSEAAREFRSAIASDPAHATAHNNLGLALAGMGRLPEAVAEYRAALALDPGLPESHLNLGNAFFRQGRLGEAVAEYREAIRLDPRASGAHSNLGFALRAMGREREAGAEFQLGRAAANH
jgi:protein O-mannosyl-transferase